MAILGVCGDDRFTVVTISTSLSGEIVTVELLSWLVHVYTFMIFDWVLIILMCSVLLVSLASILHSSSCSWVSSLELSFVLLSSNTLASSCCSLLHNNKINNNKPYVCTHVCGYVWVTYAYTCMCKTVWACVCTHVSLLVKYHSWFYHCM